MKKSSRVSKWVNSFTRELYWQKTFKWKFIDDEWQRTKQQWRERKWKNERRKQSIRDRKSKSRRRTHERRR